jgi:hypothetical protein
MGDVLWYLAIVADRANLSLPEIASTEESKGSSAFVDDLTFASLQPQRSLPLHAPTTAFERTLMRLAVQAGHLVGSYGDGTSEGYNGNLRDDLATLFQVLIEAANEAGVTLEGAASVLSRKFADKVGRVSGGWSQR